MCVVGEPTVEMGCLSTGVWSLLGMDLGEYSLCHCSHKAASAHSVMTSLPTVNMVAEGVGTESCPTGSLFQNMAPGSVMVPCHSQRELEWPPRPSTD